MISRPMLGYVFLAALRDRFFLAFPVIVLLVLSLSVFMGSAAVIEIRDFISVYAASGLRLAAVASIVLFVTFYVRRSHDMRDIEFILGRPVSRGSLVFTWAVSFAVIAMAASFLCLAGLAVISPDIPRTIDGIVMWGAGLTVELVIMALAAFFFAMVIPSATGAVLAAFGLYILARLMGDLMGIVNGKPEGVLDDIMRVVALVVPRFDLMAQSSWLVYGPGKGDPGILFILGQGVAYSGLLVTATMLDFRRRQF